MSQERWYGLGMERKGTSEAGREQQWHNLSYEKLAFIDVNIPQSHDLYQQDGIFIYISGGLVSLSPENLSLLMKSISSKCLIYYCKSSVFKHSETQLKFKLE